MSSFDAIPSGDLPSEEYDHVNGSEDHDDQDYDDAGQGEILQSFSVRGEWDQFSAHLLQTPDAYLRLKYGLPTALNSSYIINGKNIVSEAQVARSAPNSNRSFCTV